MEHEFIIDLNERGRFAAHVQRTDDDTEIACWTVDDCEESDEFPPVVDGFMRNVRDMDGLCAMLGIDHCRYVG